MTPDDPRHGTYAGMQVHWVENTEPCRPCARAHAACMRAYRQRKRRDKCAMTEGHVVGTRSGLGWPLLSAAERTATP